MDIDENIGLQISAYVRGLLTIYTNMSWKDINNISITINERFERAAWLSTDKGIMFEKTFTPKDIFK